MTAQEKKSDLVKDIFGLGKGGFPQRGIGDANDVEISPKELASKLAAKAIRNLSDKSRKSSR